MASTADLLAEVAGRIRETVHSVVEDLSSDQLGHQVDGMANSIAWLVWHQARVADDHLADAAGSEQIWTSGGWAGRFGLALDDSDTGYGHSPSEVATVRASGELLIGYADAVVDRLQQYVSQLTDADLDRVVDEAWDPPVTLAVRLVSILDDDLQHLGQAALVRGLLAH
jgi:uncharacterized damage-inducible protein DinB